MNDQPDRSWEELLRLQSAMRGVVAELRAELANVGAGRVVRDMDGEELYEINDAREESETRVLKSVIKKIEAALSPPPTANDREAEVMDTPQAP